MSVSGCCRRQLRLLSSILLLFNVYITIVNAQTPVIGGLCKLAAVDVPIGGKQTQFYLKCESGEGSDEGYGIWVVKSRATSNDETTTTPTKPMKDKSFCDRDNTIREGNTCEHSANCLQPHQDELASYYQCDANSRWMRRSCTNRLLFSFDHQACVGIETTTMAGKTIAHEPMNHHSDVTISFTNGNNNNNNGDDGNDPFAHRGVHHFLQSSSSLIDDVRYRRYRRDDLNISTNRCADGRDALKIECSMDQPCPVGFGCVGNRCCKILSSKLCSDGSSPDGSCSDGVSCTAPYICTSQNLCCPQINARTRATLMCPPREDGTLQICNVSSDCASGFFCSPLHLCCSLGGIIQKPVEQQCPGGAIASVGRCAVDGDCPHRFWCIGGVCCPTPHNTPDDDDDAGRCSDGSPYQSRCMVDEDCPTHSICDRIHCCPIRLCPSGFPPLNTTLNCVLEGCPDRYECSDVGCCSTKAVMAECPNGREPLAYPPWCSTDRDCPVGYGCAPNRLCCQIERCDDGSVPLREPVECTTNVSCPLNFTCHEQFSFCCPTQALCDDGMPAVHSCSSERACPTGYRCSDDALCCPVQTRCYDGTSAIHTCNSTDDCMPPYTCQLNICCMSPTKLDPSQQSIANYPQSPFEQATTTDLPSAAMVIAEPPLEEYNALTTQIAAIGCRNGYRSTSTTDRCSDLLPCPSPVDECIDNMCCRRITDQCPDEFIRLHSPHTCESNDECPETAVCIDHVCCQSMITTCDDGSNATAFCSSEYPRCPHGFECQAELCCANNQTSNVCSDDDEECLPVNENIEEAEEEEEDEHDEQQLLLLNECSDRSQPIANCSNGTCPDGSVCERNLVCCSGTTTDVDDVRRCSSDGSISIASCSSLADCPASGYICNVNGRCCPSIVDDNNLPTCPDGSEPTSNNCTSTIDCEFGFNCLRGGICCLQRICADGSEALSSPERCNIVDRCPIGYQCSGGICCPQRTCPDGEQSDVYCDTYGRCPNGMSCVGPVCCYNFLQLLRSIRVCVDGSTPLAHPERCERDSCPPGYRCERGQCCANATTCPVGHHNDGVCDERCEGDCIGGSCCLPAQCPVGFQPAGICGQQCAHTDQLCVDGVCCARLCPDRSLALLTIDCRGNANCPSGYRCVNRTPKRTPTGMCCKVESPADRCADGSSPLHMDCNPLSKPASSSCPVDFECEQFGKCCRRRANGGAKANGITVVSSQHLETFGLRPGISKAIGRHETAKKKNRASSQCVETSTRCADDDECPVGWHCRSQYPSSSSSGSVVCTFTGCSNSNGCSSGGSCNNGYCCSTGTLSAAIIQNDATGSNISSIGSSSLNIESRDWPVGPPGYGFPSNLATLDQVLIRAAGDGSRCAGGFTSSMRCGNDQQCPPGLFCDSAINLCCPLLLPLTEERVGTNNDIGFSNEQRGPSYPNFVAESMPYPSTTATPFTNSYLFPAPPSSTSHFTDYNSNNNYNPNSSVRLKFSQPTTNSGGCSSGGCSSCTSGCPRGYSGCCGTQQASCCMLQLCPGGVQSTGRSCYNSCPSGQSCISGVCCPSLSCPNGGSSTGSCSNNGYCNQGSICIQSLGVCCPSSQNGISSNQYSCPNGGQAVGQCVNGACGTGYSCNYGTNLCCGGVSVTISNQNQFSCSDGTQAAGACIQGLCGTGFTCISNLCCRGLNNNPRCLDGTNPLGTCLNGLCPTNYQCTTGNLCCAANTCASGVSLGTCISGLCPNGYTCISNQCCPSTTSTSTSACPNNLAAIGPCVSGGCPVGYACLTASNSCCPSTSTTTCSDGSTPIGVCIGGACPTGYSCTNNVCCVTAGTTTTCPAMMPQNNGPCIGGAGGQCPAGSMCVGTICCGGITRLHRHPSIDSDPDMIYGGTGVSIFGGQLSECPNGQEPIGQCINGICGIGYTCMDNTCCPNDLMTGNNLNVCPNGQPGVGACFMGGVCGTGFTCDTRTNLCCSIANGNINGNSVVATVCTDGSAPLGTCPTGQNTCPTGYVCEGTICCRLTTSMNIGSRCEYPQQCAGFAQGLATCVDFTCRCQPLAYVQGVACVRRRTSLRLKFQDASAIDTDEMKKINATSST